ncbi:MULTISPECIES: AMP-binding protein [unclassified Paenibacillus]|uniref:phenylacetate--CoA ligase family protein n=1 Tax=unclassified Paenibacillus TaxID=185978 RepID=UPI001AE70E88|nr:MULTISPECIES: AMP-binding protein [unclassified Paenibacillus]MBP1154026.1 phenylacetate-CoA ligase [Paenibacillus sp. PvP091]MBP1170589.1 phenylacetate-CoA ligase [Paenibacillus sp. PvR098]MBP2441617.1 phenylacetate-CoA ligase [Paenibacillus sp. PvP052]
MSELYQHLPWYRSPRYSDELEHELCTQPREKIKEIQSLRFKQVVNYAWDNIPFYRWLWSEAGVSPSHIHTIDDIQKLPTWNKNTQKLMIEKSPPFGNYYTFSGLSDAHFIVSTSGTTGSPIMMPLNEDDFPGLQDTFARTMGMVGVNSKDIVQVLFTFSTMGAAWCGTAGALGVGATVLPASSGKTTPSGKQIQWIKQAGVTVLYGTASYIKHLADVAENEGIDLVSSSVRILLTAGEMVSDATSKEIEQLWGAKHFDFYGTVDTMTWSSVNCEHSRLKHGKLGMHVWEDFGLIEVLDPNGKRVDNKEYGNMTVTSWAWKNSPRIRFSTGDRVAVDDTPCTCGRTLTRMLPILGRVDDMIRIKGQNIYPLAIESLLKSLEFEVHEYMVEVDSHNGRDEITLIIEQKNNSNDDLSMEINKRFQAAFNVTPIVKMVPLGSTAEMTKLGKEPKVKRIFDKRHKSIKV